MIELGVVLLAVIGCVWLFGALVCGLFKLTFGLIGAIFGGLFGLLAFGIVAILLLPFVILAALPLLVPVLCTAALVWWIVRASRTHQETPQSAQD